MARFCYCCCCCCCYSVDLCIDTRILNTPATTSHSFIMNTTVSHEIDTVSDRAPIHKKPCESCILRSFTQFSIRLYNSLKQLDILNSFRYYIGMVCNSNYISFGSIRNRLRCLSRNVRIVFIEIFPKFGFILMFSMRTYMKSC